MLLGVSETLFAPQTLLWLAASLIAAGFLLGAINRRRGRLTDSLKQYVRRQQPEEPPRSDDG